uniref:Kindlin-2 N-terminal domain-containing protein n=1 Tax=Anopheles culicifacies TaxID=139723 RepID=A0A182MII0_9DIPT
MIHVGDNTWNLKVYITDLQVQKTLRVRGDLHIGGVMLRLVDPVLEVLRILGKGGGGDGHWANPFPRAVWNAVSCCTNKNTQAHTSKPARLTSPQPVNRNAESLGENVKTPDLRLPTQWINSPSVNNYNNTYVHLGHRFGTARTTPRG